MPGNVEPDRDEPWSADVQIRRMMEWWSEEDEANGADELDLLQDELEVRAAADAEAAQDLRRMNELLAAAEEQRRQVEALAERALSAAKTSDRRFVAKLAERDLLGG